jgi:vanillate O-demethylase ferredoxin subunit
MSVSTLTVRVIAKTAEAQDIRSYVLADPNGAALPAFTAGSHVDVHLPGGLIRQYSLCNDPRERDRYWLGVLREPASRGGSTAMHDRVNVGDLLTISVPRNNFALNEGARHSILIAGGIGVTPIMAMAERLAVLGASFEMHYLARTRARMAFHDYLLDRPFRDKLKLHFDDGPQEQLLDVPGLLRDYQAGVELYLCGPKGLMDHVLGHCKHWPEHSVHREYFTAEPQAGAPGDQAFKVKLKSSGKVFEIPANKTIVTVLAEHGIDVPISCEQGICGTCLTGVVEGTPDHRDCFLTDDERAANDQFTPCCSRSKSPLLVMDL